MPESKTRKGAMKEVMMSLGGGVINVDLSKDQENFALDYALKIYRQRASNATHEVGIIFKYKKFTQRYDLGDSYIVDIKAIHRNVIGSSAANDYEQDPFLMMYVNQMMNAVNQNMAYGSIATIHMQHNYIKTLEQITAGRIDYVWNNSTKILDIFNKIGRDEVFTFIVEAYREDDELLNDTYVRPWLIAYAVAKAKMMMGEIRSKFQTLAGPGGGVTLNGSELKQEAQAEMEKLDEQLQNEVTSDEGYEIFFG